MSARHLAAALALAILLCLLGVGLAVSRAEEVEPGRYVPSARGGRQVVQEMAEQHFAPEWVGWAVRVAVCESSLNPNADTNPPYIGLWQIDPHIHGGRVRRIFGRWRSLYEPEVNAAVAADILADQGPGAWPICGR